MQSATWSRCVERGAAKALGKLAKKGDPHTIDALIECLEDGDSQVRCDAVESLAQVAEGIFAKANIY